MKGENMGILIGKRGKTDSRFPSVSCKPCGKQTSERICESETGYGKLSCEKRRDAEASRKEYRTQGKENKLVSLEPMNPYEVIIIHSALQSYRM